MLCDVMRRQRTQSCAHVLDDETRNQHLSYGSAVSCLDNDHISSLVMFFWCCDSSMPFTHLLPSCVSSPLMFLFSPHVYLVLSCLSCPLMFLFSPHVSPLLLFILSSHISLVLSCCPVMCHASTQGTNILVCLFLDESSTFSVLCHPAASDAWKHVPTNEGPLK